MRATDRVEELAAWLLTTLGLLAVLGAGVVGLAAHDAALQPGRIGDAVRVRAVLLADVPTAPTAVQRVPYTPHDVPVSFTAADGSEQIGELTLRSRLRAGAEVTAWVDRDGQLSARPPRHPDEAVAFGVGAGLTATAGAWALLTLLWAGLRRVLDARNDAGWAREWARVEPLWSRRVR